MKGELHLIDSNILVYAYDYSDEIKNEKARKLLEECWTGKTEFAICLQNLSEFYIVITKKVKNPLEKKEAKEIVEEFIEFKNWKKLTQKESTLIKAMEIADKYNVGYYDALIAATMLENNLTRIYTEDVKDFNKIKELEVINPLL